MGPFWKTVGFIFGYIVQLQIIAGIFMLVVGVVVFLAILIQEASISAVLTPGRVHMSILDYCEPLKIL
ncbi:Hypothetical protein NTJ_11206 [Nesidiocoris tenuis]|uniref:Uncharacterized protein n=1 Tax=Nesidiocoris tenuis TaxID=355587 RepID=A0ABN7B1U5_9HEMI|nr:Hypothetical protein NTJ_11206 [Nesidiocoris tenuis]